MDYLILGTLFSGTFLIFIGCLGVFRLPDVYCRAHALTKAHTLGIALVFISAWMYLGTSDSGIKLFVAIVFQFLTIPLSGHMLALVAFRKHVPRWKHRDIADHRA